MTITILFHTNDSWYKHRIIWSGIYSVDGVTLFGDSFSHNIVGQHASTLSGYADFGTTVTLTRLETTGNLAVAGYEPSGIPYTIVGPETNVDGGAMANYLDEFSTAMGSVYIETSPASGIYSISGGGNLYWHPLYPPSGNWAYTTSGIDYNLNDVIGLDYPDNPRVLISSPELANTSGRPTGIWVVNVASGADQTLIYETVYSPDIAKNIYITDLEAQRILG